MKSASPLLGSPEELDYDSARRSRMADQPRSLESVTEQIVRYLSGMFIWGHPRADQRRAGTDHSKHHRRDAAVHLQPESRQ